MDGCYSKFDDPSAVISTVKLGSLVLAELWHGPTGAFKDLSLSVMGKMVDFFLRKRNKRSTILVSTSGDTGSAAIQSVLGSKHIQIVVMYPRHMVSRMQELQMTTVDATNVHVFSVDGSSDDSNGVIASLQADMEFYKEYNITVFNSSNICRILVQSIHFAYLYLKQCPEVDKTITFCVPTGGMGNASSGMFIRSLGLPIKFLLAVNENDAVHQTFLSGHYSPGLSVQHTLSSAMDTITNPHYMERVWYYLAGDNSETIKAIMQEFEAKKSCTLPPFLMAEAARCICTATVNQEKLLSTMVEVWNEHQYLLCPHTSVGVAAALEHLSSMAGQEEGAMVVLATATAHKFLEAVETAGLPPPVSNKFEAVKKLPEKKKFMEKGQEWPQILKEAIKLAWE